ncbi:IPT/TIG domain-containing protein [Kitasatospora sp. NPDC059088]|uniref:IPT/TIG domain-containing protein n=1 Tax=Kitasatospora sp. NPDC059088 TaxID=3346722 RepID=UPI00368B494F
MVSNLTTKSGPVAGGTQVYLQGTNLTYGSITFGGVPAAHVSCGPSFCSATSPAGAAAWFERVHTGLVETNRSYPFLAYGSDWLAFAHLVIGAAFWGPLKDPVRNIWVIRWAVLACGAVIPLALICGPLRGIPLAWRFIDMSFGVFGVVPLLIVLRALRPLERSFQERLAAN